MRKIVKTKIIDYLLFGCFLLVGCFVLHGVAVREKTQFQQEEEVMTAAVGEEERNIYANVCGSVGVESVSASVWDITALDSWCGEVDGTMRMLSANVCVINSQTQEVTLEDEEGQLWVVLDPTQTFTMQDFLLLWVADKGTPLDKADDELMKVWKEVA